MDTLTHALSGVLVLNAARGRVDRPRLLAVAVAAAFPDLDYLLILVDPLAFLNLHRGPTHSLVLLPLWAGLLSLPLAPLLGIRWRECFALCALGLLVHIAGDWVTLYGTKLWYPLSDRAFALRASFDVNPWIAVVVVLAVLLGHWWRARASAFLGLGLIALLLSAQNWLGSQATRLAVQRVDEQGNGSARVLALPQPLSPFHWALVVGRGDGYEMAYVDLLGLWSGDASLRPWVARMFAAYRAPGDLEWRLYPAPSQTPLSAEAWAQPRFAGFRRFAELPVLLGVDPSPQECCVWFTDLRHLLPTLPASFRYGLCKTGDGTPWRPYRLRYFTAGVRQAL
ncbi:MAG: metal-dependent hydrolase [Alphaproteobacteria bacterium]|nr:metal-dependent hydrolase [Alphaproteobacteria bacterium]